MRISIARKIEVSALLMATALVVTSVIAVVALRRLNTTSDSVVRHYESLDHIREVQRDFNRLVMPPNDYLVHGDIYERVVFDRLVDELRHEMARAPARTAAQIAAVQPTIEDVVAKGHSILAVKLPEGRAQGAQLMESLDADAERVQRQLDRIAFGVAAQVEGALLSTKTSRQEARLLLWCIVGFVVFNAVLGAYLITRSLTEPIATLAAGVQRIARGDLDSRIELSSTDEIGELAAAFNDMTESLVEQRNRLVEAERMSCVGELAVTLKHEINNAVQGINSALELVLSDEHDPVSPDRRALLSSVMAEASRIGVVISKLEHVETTVSIEYVNGVRRLQLS